MWWDLIDYLFYINYCVYVNPKIIYPSPWMVVVEHVQRLYSRPHFIAVCFRDLHRYCPFYFLF